MSGDMINMIRVTEALIEAGSTSGCGFTFRQIRALGEYPRKGWRRRAVGRVIAHDKALEFLTTARRRAHRLPIADAQRQLAELAPTVTRKLHQTADTACPLCRGEGVTGPTDATGRSTEREPCPLCDRGSARRVAGDPPPWI
jgi:hypothetical protein